MGHVDPNPPPSPARKSVNRQIVAFQAELREIAARQMARERPDHTLQPTALVSEAYLRLCRQENLAGASRAVFLAAGAETIRRVLIDHAREKNAAKRGGDADRITLSSVDPAAPESTVDLLDLDAALQKLERQSPRMYKVVACRFFAGMTVPQIAEALAVSLRTVEDDWAFAKAWLRAELEG